MPKKRYAHARIAMVVRELDSAAKVAEVSRRLAGPSFVHVILHKGAELLP